MFYCSECDYESPEGGRCPQCNVPLVNGENLDSDFTGDEEVTEDEDHNK